MLEPKYTCDLQKLYADYLDVDEETTASAKFDVRLKLSTSRAAASYMASTQLENQSRSGSVSSSSSQMKATSKFKRHFERAIQAINEGKLRDGSSCGGD